MLNSTEQIADEILVMDAQGGRQEAFDMLVSRWQKRLWWHALNLTGRTDAAWDITQESWLDIVRGLTRLIAQSSRIFTERTSKGIVVDGSRSLKPFIRVGDSRERPNAGRNDRRQKRISPPMREGRGLALGRLALESGDVNVTNHNESDGHLEEHYCS